MSERCGKFSCPRYSGGVCYCPGIDTSPNLPPAPRQDEQGLERRYLVRRLGDVEGKHRDCRFFVLDPAHDPIARTALAQYADDAACPPELSRDLWRWLGEVTP